MEVAATATQRVMPNLAGGTHAHNHSVHSALVSLSAMGVASHQITLRRTGREAVQSGHIVRQKPAPGTPLQGGTEIVLEIAGLGYTHALPVGMWDSGGEEAMGTREILEHFDDPLEKLKHWLHEGAPLFRIAPEDPAACARWLALFGVDAREWPRSMWYRLASLIAAMPRLSCSEEGLATVLQVLLGLPVRSFASHPTLAVLPESTLSHLGARASRLGVDLLIGDAIEDLAVTEIEIGPVPLPAYERFNEAAEGRMLLQQVLTLLQPLSGSYELRWTVGEENQPPRLGHAADNSRLGINTHMGRTRTLVQGAPPIRLATPDLPQQMEAPDGRLQ